MKLGIPRGLSFYSMYPFLYGFFDAIGIEVVLSDKTTKKTLSKGSSLVVTETCLPVKIFVGQVLNLIEKGVENIFIQSIAPKIYNCSKIRGLPDLIRNVVKKPFNMIEPTLDKSQKGQGLYQFLLECVQPFGIVDMERIKKASKTGWRVYNNFQVMLKSGMPYEKALKNAISGKLLIEKDETEYPVSIALVSHAYNIYDERASMKVIDKLNKMGVKVYTAYQLTEEQLEEGVTSLGQEVYWANEAEMTGCAGYYLKDNKIDGLITITAFGCGPDSLMLERVTRKSKQFNKPLLNLTIDEHTGEAGFITRLEAFVDMLYRKKRMQGIVEEGFAPTSNVMEFI